MTTTAAVSICGQLRAMLKRNESRVVNKRRRGRTLHERIDRLAADPTTPPDVIKALRATLFELLAEIEDDEIALRDLQDHISGNCSGA